jgi:hypothetical protein
VVNGFNGSGFSFPGTGVRIIFPSGLSLTSKIGYLALMLTGFNNSDDDCVDGFEVCIK